jgi:uncharacterized protein (UPF0303 family)
MRKATRRALPLLSILLVCSALVGAVAVSGMAPLDDHNLIVEALRDATT